MQQPTKKNVFFTQVVVHMRKSQIAVIIQASWYTNFNSQTQAIVKN